MRDIENRKDIEHLIDTFYKRLLQDKTISHFFTQVVVLDWEVHIPLLYDFWESMLFDTYTYKGNAMHKHISLHQKQSLEPEHFERWLYLWEQTILQNYKGQKANKAIEKAKQIGSLMLFKIQKLKK